MGSCSGRRGLPRRRRADALSRRRCDDRFPRRRLADALLDPAPSGLSESRAVKSCGPSGSEDLAFAKRGDPTASSQRGGPPQPWQAVADRTEPAWLSRSREWPRSRQSLAFVSALLHKCSIPPSRGGVGRSKSRALFDFDHLTHSEESSRLVVATLDDSATDELLPGHRAGPVWRGH
jgi:hypothetical protein